MFHGWGRSPGGGNDDLLQYSCLKNPVDRGAWWATVYGVKKSQTRLKERNTHAGTWIMDRAVVEVVGNSFRNSCMVDMSDERYVWFLKTFI